MAIAFDSIRPDLDVWVSYSPHIQGSKLELFMTGKIPTYIYYRVWYQEPGLDIWYEMTSGWSEPIMGDRMFRFICPVPLDKIGRYPITVWCKRVGKTGLYATVDGSYDIAQSFTVNVVEDGVNVLTMDGRVMINEDLDKTEFSFGEALSISWIEDIAGMEPPYKYCLHAYSCKENKWFYHLAPYKEPPIVWTPPYRGDWLLDIWIQTKTGVRAYQAWKHKLVTVT